MTDLLLQNDVLRGLQAFLTEDARVQLILGQPPRLYDVVPEDPVFPYLSYGNIHSEKINADGPVLTTHRVTMHLWSRYCGRTETLDLLSYMVQVLESVNLGETHAHLINSSVLYTDLLRAPDGQTFQGLIRLNMVTEARTGETV